MRLGIKKVKSRINCDTGNIWITSGCSMHIALSTGLMRRVCGVTATETLGASCPYLLVQGKGWRWKWLGNKSRNCTDRGARCDHRGVRLQFAGRTVRDSFQLADNSE